MDHAAGLRGGAIRVAQVFHRYAEEKGWEPGSYLIFANINTAWGIIRVGVATDHFEKDPEYDEVSDDCSIELITYLRQELRSDPGLYESISLNFCTFDDEAGLVTLYYPILGEDEFEIDFSLLNPGVPDPRTAIVRGPALGGNGQ
jgi:hypothetical protein